MKGNVKIVMYVSLCPILKYLCGNITKRKYVRTILCLTKLHQRLFISFSITCVRIQSFSSDLLRVYQSVWVVIIERLIEIAMSGDVT